MITFIIQKRVLLFATPTLFRKYKKGKDTSILGISSRRETARYTFLSLEVSKVTSALEGKGLLIYNAATINQEMRSKFAKIFDSSGM